jgi:hypothetical protein
MQCTGRILFLVNGRHRDSSLMASNCLFASDSLQFPWLRPSEVSN